VSVTVDRVDQPDAPEDRRSNSLPPLTTAIPEPGVRQSFMDFEM
jgi:hypothetical protein